MRTVSVCAVIVTYNRVDVLKNSLAGIIAQIAKASTILVVDNNSSDGTKEYLTSIQGQNNIRSIHIPENIGYAGGIERGINHALQTGEYDYFWIMDDDTYHESGTLEALINKIENSGYGLIGLHGMDIRFGKKVPVRSEDALSPCDVVLIDGALLKAEVAKQIGAPSERFFMMCEDHEYCLRMKKHGYTIGSLNNFPVQRLYLGSSGGVFSKSTLWRGYYQARNHILILKQYFSVWYLLHYSWLQFKYIIAALIYAPDRFTRIKLRLKGIWHGIRGIDGKTLDPGTLKFRTGNHIFLMSNGSE